MVLENGEKVIGIFVVWNVDCVIGMIVGFFISKKYGVEGLLEDIILFDFVGLVG